MQFRQLLLLLLLSSIIVYTCERACSANCRLSCCRCCSDVLISRCSQYLVASRVYVVLSCCVGKRLVLLPWLLLLELASLNRLRPGTRFSEISDNFSTNFPTSFLRSSICQQLMSFVRSVFKLIFDLQITRP